MRIKFWKMQGLGNDFALIDARQLPLQPLMEAAVGLCDRHFGIGADGLLLWTGSAEQPRMTVVNADGSVPEMCGNGLRCFVKWLGDHQLPGAQSVAVQTGAGALQCAVERGAPGSADQGRVTLVQVAMGIAQWAPELVPVLSDAPLLGGLLADLPQPTQGPPLRWTALSTGNPHLVTFDPLSPQERLALGPQLSSHARFPRQINVEFARVQQGLRGPEIHVDVFERGCGWTLACGTGATATVHAAVRLGLVPAGQAVPVRLPGGWLSIEIGADGSAIMRGPAEEVFEGSVDIAFGSPTQEPSL